MSDIIELDTVNSEINQAGSEIYQTGSESKFECPFCHKAFTRRYNLKRHVLNLHSNDLNGGESDNEASDGESDSDDESDCLESSDEEDTTSEIPEESQESDSVICTIKICLPRLH